MKVICINKAVSKNTISIIVPCHRVVNKDTKKSNFSWGIKFKEALLKAERPY